MTARILSLLIGYFFGCFLTADLVAGKRIGKSASEVGEGNPGMANIMSNLGFIPGIITLAGDLGKTILAWLVTLILFRSHGWIVVLYAGLGCTLGHDFPFWRHFRGGKGVATTSMAIVLYSFWMGLLANIVGMLLVFTTQYLCIAGPAIPIAFTLLMLLKGDPEAAALGAVLSALALRAHSKEFLAIRSGGTDKTDVLGAIRKKLQKN